MQIPVCIDTVCRRLKKPNNHIDKASDIRSKVEEKNCVRGQSHDQLQTNEAEVERFASFPDDQGQGYQGSFGEVSLFINGQPGPLSLVQWCTEKQDGDWPGDSDFSYF